MESNVFIGAEINEGSRGIEEALNYDDVMGLRIFNSLDTID